MKGKIILIVIIAALLVGVFYRFQWRPGEIRKECINQCPRGIQAAASLKLGFDCLKDCLYRNGLEK